MYDMLVSSPSSVGRLLVKLLPFKYLHRHQNMHVKEHDKYEAYMRTCSSSVNSPLSAFICLFSSKSNMFVYCPIEMHGMLVPLLAASSSCHMCQNNTFIRHLASPYKSRMLVSRPSSVGRLLVRLLLFIYLQHHHQPTNQPTTG